MLTIQEVGTQILNNTPDKFYIFAGSEYGIKDKYIQILTKYYGECKESTSVKELLDLMSVKHLIPLNPTLYVVRYDEEFLTSLTDATKSKIRQSKIVGTIVCIYDTNTKGVSKLSKYLPEYTVNIDKVNINFVIKYLHSDFPKLPDRLINLAAKIGNDYGDAQNICKSMSMVTPEELFALSDEQLTKLFGKSIDSTEDEFRRGVAARNFKYLVRLVEKYSGELDSLFYTILSTMIEIDKLISNTYAQSDIREYVKRWNHKDVFNMFMNTYEELRKLRSYATNSYASLIYLFGLLNFSEIPDVGGMSS